MTKGALEMGNEEYIIQWDDMTPEAKAKKRTIGAGSFFQNRPYGLYGRHGSDFNRYQG